MPPTPGQGVPPSQGAVTVPIESRQPSSLPESSGDNCQEPRAAPKRQSNAAPTCKVLAEPVRGMSDEALAGNPATLSLPAKTGRYSPEPTAGLSTEPSAGGSPSEAATAIAGYEILGELGRGGMGVVYMARQLSLNRVVALKMILAGQHANLAARERFIIEAEAIARLQHPNFVQVYEVSKHNDKPYFSLEYCAGGSLDKRLNGTPLPAQQAAKLIETLARAMHFAHSKNVIHRDLKPANVLFSEDGTPKISDFGLAKKLDETAHTASGAIMGTPSYMAPEQAGASHDSVGPASDIYALGAILYELLTGRPPFKAANALDTMIQVVHEEPVPPRRLQPKTPRDLETICLKCIEKQPHQRYPSAEALARDLRRFLDGDPIQARRVSRLERAIRWIRRRPTAAALIGVLCAVAVGLPIAAMQFSDQLARQRQAEEKRLLDVRAEVLDLYARGQTAYRSLDLKQSEMLLDKALSRIDAEPALAELRKDVEEILAPVKSRLTAIDAHQRFVRDRDEALFHATLASGENFQASSKTAREKAGVALGLVGLSSAGHGQLTLHSALIPDEQTEITSGCYALLLMLAEIEGGRPQRQAPDERQRQLRVALTILDQADRLGVQTRAIHIRRARYLTELGSFDAAKKEQALVLVKAPITDSDPQDHYLVGHEFYIQGDIRQANQEFRRALQLDPNHFWTHYFTGICCVTSGQPDVAVAHLTICQTKQPSLIWIYLLRGFALGQLGDYTAAEADFDRALSMKPSTATRYVIHNNRGVMRVGQQEAWSKGVEDLHQAAALRPDQYQAQASLAEAYRLRDRLDDALKHLDQAIVLASRQAQHEDLEPATLALLHHSRARLHLQRHDRGAAVRDLSEAVRMAGNDRAVLARVQADKGRVLHLQERFAEALTAYDTALTADPARVDVLRGRGEVLLTQRRFGEAAAAFDAYLDKGGAPSAAVYRQRGLARAQIGRRPEAIDDYGRALDAKPKDEEKASLYLYRGQEYLAINALEPALRDFEEAVRLSPNSADAYLGCAHARIRLGDVARGLADAEKAVKGQPKEARLWHGAARVYAQAAGQLKAQQGQEPAQARLRATYQNRALVLLFEAVSHVPLNQRQAYLRDNVMKDTALYPVRQLREFVQLVERVGARAP